jgi:quercetin dioxygenase-like cupin family protein
MMNQAHATVSVDDDRVRVTTWTFETDQACTGPHRHEFDYLVVPVTGGTFTVTGADGSVRTMTQTAGTPYLGTAGTEHEVVNVSGQLASFVEIELKR